MTWAMALKHFLTNCIGNPSGPHAPLLFIVITVCHSWSGVIGCTRNAAVPTRGRRTDRRPRPSAGSPAATDAAVVTPMLAKYRFSVSGSVSGCCWPFPVLPCIIGRIQRYIEPRPASAICRSILARASRCMADLTRRFRSAYRSRSGPRSAARRSAIRRLVSWESGGGRGLRILTRRTGAWLSSASVIFWIK